MPAEMSIEVEHLLVDLAGADGKARRAREDLDKRIAQIADSVWRERQVGVQGERERLGQKLADLRRGKYRSELASLASEVVSAERRRADVLRKLEAFPQFGESTPAVDIAVEHDGERGFTIRIGGRASQFKLPAIIDRGVWRGDGRYERGDAVTSDGSLWIAREDNPSHEPGKGPQWRLAVTKGKNGRDAKFAGRI